MDTASRQTFGSDRPESEKSGRRNEAGPSLAPPRNVVPSTFVSIVSPTLLNVVEVSGMKLTTAAASTVAADI
jgi:hypothetical protein